MVTTLPAGVGVFIYPIVEAVWGELSLLKVIGYTVLSSLSEACWQYDCSWIIFNINRDFAHKPVGNTLQHCGYRILNRAIFTITSLCVHRLRGSERVSDGKPVKQATNHPKTRQKRAGSVFTACMSMRASA